MNVAAGLAANLARPIAPKGVICALLTSLTASLEPDLPRMVEHGRWLLDNGCDGLSMLGTTGEANSLSMKQRLGLLEGLVKAGLPASRMIPGVGAPSAGDATEYARHALGLGCGGQLLLPPFFYKNPPEDGLFAFYARVIEGVADARMRLYLYHIPQISAVPIPHSLVERLIGAFPGIVTGVKDSSGDWNYAETLLKRIPGLAVYCGSEIFLLPNLRAGGAGCISGTVNFTAPLAARVRDAARDRSRDTEAESLRARLDGLRRAIESRPLIPALKALQAEITGKADWARVLPPFVQLSDAQRSELFVAIDALLPRGPGRRWTFAA